MKPADVLSPGHTLDATPGKAELDFSSGLSNQGIYDGNGGCSSLYCHGDGSSSNGSSTFTGGAKTCTSCHTTPPSSGRHNKHKSYDCDRCHSTVALGKDQIIGPAEHVNGQKNVVFSGGGTFSGGQCSSIACHGSKSW
jgi:predicted CxxxxCH...CXXCH cytochrome family protein